MIKYSFKVKNKIKTTVSILKDKINGLKSMIIIKIYYLFGFESFNLLDIFDDSRVYNNLENNLFGIFVCYNIEEFTKDFNHHMKNYNVELLFIKIIKVKKEILS